MTNKTQKIGMVTLSLLASLFMSPIATNATDNPTNGKVVFQEDFDKLQVGQGKKWGWETAAYEFCTTNPKNNKLDRLTTKAMKTEAGNLHIQATPQKDGLWETGLVTTGDSCDSGGNQFQVKAGDFLLIHVKLPTGNVGGWPGFWTWKNGNNEIDVFEWHANRPHLLELTNHVHPAGSTYENTSLIGPGKWIYIGTKLGEKNNTWYVGSTKDNLRAVWSDHSGVGPNWSAYMIANLSVDNGQRAPQGSQPIDFYIDSIQVYR